MRCATDFIRLLRRWQKRKGNTRGIGVCWQRGRKGLKSWQWDFFAQRQSQLAGHQCRWGKADDSRYCRDTLNTMEQS